MRWTYRDVRALPVHVFAHVVEFVNKHVVGQGGDLDDLG